MKIQFINHSSLIVHSGPISLMCDFWKEGAAFDNGWELLCPTEFAYEDFENITHLWFSHEHPDHFSPPNLKRIPQEFRNTITVLFQKTCDRRVVGFCEKIGFAEVIELEPYEAINLAEDVEVICAPYGASYADVDSWICVKSSEATFLNFNDCEFVIDNRLEEIKRVCGNIDLLATQFSFASKQGDADSAAWIAPTKEYYLNKLDTKIAAFSPKFTIPFASYVYWSHHENWYLNAGSITVHEAIKNIAANQSIPVVMYPQDQWTYGGSWKNDASLKKYDDRYRWLRERPESSFTTSVSVDESTLLESARNFLEKMQKGGTQRQIRQYIAIQHSDIRTYSRPNSVARKLGAVWSGLTGNCADSRIFVEDLKHSYTFSLIDGLVRANHTRESCDIAISSHALNYCFSVPFGGETLQINGRFQNISVDGWQYLSRIFFLARRIDQEYVLPRFVLSTAIIKSLGLLG